MADMDAAIRAKLDSMVEDAGESYQSCAGCEGDCNCQAYLDYQSALLAVLDDHAANELGDCRRCANWDVYRPACDQGCAPVDTVSCPCPTLLAVASALGVEA